MIKVRTLSCGARLIMEDIPYVHSVSIGIWTRTGAVNEAEDISGVSHFIEHMMFKGTEKRTAKQIAEDADKIAGQHNAFTGKEATCYYIKTLSSNFHKGADLLVDMFLNSRFEEEEMDKERQVIFEEMKMIEDSPEDDIHDMIAELVFRNKPLSKSIAGTRESLLSIDRSILKNYYDQEYTANSIVISLAGNFSEEEAVAFFDGKFSGLRREKIFALATCQTEYIPTYRMKVKDIEQTHICIAAPGISKEDPRYYPLSLLNNILGGSMSSRLFQNIREEKGLAYSVYSLNSAFSQDGYFCIYAGISHDKAHDCIGAIREELLKLKKHGVTKEEIEIAKEQIKGSYIYSMENPNSRMFHIGRNLVLDSPIDSAEEVIAKIESITDEQFYEAAELITDISSYCGAAISNQEIPIEEYIRG